MVDQVNSLEELGQVAEGVEAPVAADAPVITREPVKDALGRSYATGKRKDAVARVWIKPGSGKVTVNGQEMNVYFARPVLQMILAQPFSIAGVTGQFDVVATVKGGVLKQAAASQGKALLFWGRAARERRCFGHKKAARLSLRSYLRHAASGLP